MSTSNVNTGPNSAGDPEQSDSPQPAPDPNPNNNDNQNQNVEANEEQQHLRWIQSSREQQQEFYLYLGNRKWDLIPKADMTILTRKVAFGFYGPPTIEFDDSIENENPNAATNSSQLFGYTEVQMESVKVICKKITELAQVKGDEKDIRFACIFICGRTKTNPENFTIPVFKTLKHEKDGIEEDYFIDTNCRLYDGWADYLKSNQLPACDYCYPRNGIYSGIEFCDDTEGTGNDKSKDGADGSSDDDDDDDDYYFRRQFQVDIEYGVSPASEVVSQTLSVMDKAAAVVGLGATAILAVGMLPVITLAAPVAAVAAIGGGTTGVYAAGRSVFNLYDRGTHGQSIGIFNSEARNSWLTVAGGALGFAQARMMSNIARAAELGEVAGVANRATFLALSSGVIFVSGVGLFSSFFEIMERYENNQLTRLDILQFSAHALFFSNSLMNFRTAESVIREVQNDIINGHRQDLAGNANRNRRYRFNKRMRQNVESRGEMAGNAQTVQSINNIRSTQDFYQALVDKSSGDPRRPTEADGNIDTEQRLLNENQQQQQQQNQTPLRNPPEERASNTPASDLGSSSASGSNAGNPGSDSALGTNSSESSGTTPVSRSVSSSTSSGSTSSSGSDSNLGTGSGSQTGSSSISTSGTVSGSSTVSGSKSRAGSGSKQGSSSTFSSNLNSGTGTGSGSSSGSTSKSGAVSGSKPGSNSASKSSSSSGSGSASSSGSGSKSGSTSGTGSSKPVAGSTSASNAGTTLVSKSGNLANSKMTSKVTTTPITTRPNGTRQFQISPEVKQLMLINAQNLAIGAISSDEFQALMKNLYKKLEPWIQAVISKLCEYFQVQNLEDIEIKGVKIFQRLNQVNIEKFAAFLKTVYSVYGPDIIKLVQMIAELKNIPIENWKDFCVCLVNICIYVQQKISEYQTHEVDFDFFDIPGGDQFKYFLDKVYRTFQGESSQVLESLSDFEEIVPKQNNSEGNENGDLLSQLQDMLEIPSSEASNAHSFIRNDENHATEQGQGDESDITMYSCFRFKDFDPDSFDSSGNLREYFYIEIASDLLGVPLTDDWGNAEALVIYEESSTFIYFNNDDTLAYGIQVEKIGDGNHCYGIATILL